MGVDCSTTVYAGGPVLFHPVCLNRIDCIFGGGDRVAPVIFDMAPGDAPREFGYLYWVR